MTEEEFNEWLEDKPQVIKDLADKLPPWNQYKHRVTGYKGFLTHYNDDGTVTVMFTEPPDQDREFEVSSATVPSDDLEVV